MCMRLRRARKNHRYAATMANDMKTFYSCLAAFFLLTVLLPGCSGRYASTEQQPLGRIDAKAGKTFNSYYYYLKAQHDLKQKNLTEAADGLQQAINLDPAASFLKIELAKLKIQQNDAQNALNLVNEVLNKDPDHVEALMLSGGIHQSLKQYEEAKRAYQKIIDIDPQQERIYLLLGGLHMEAGELDQALKVYQQLVAYFPASYAGHFFIGKIYKTKGTIDAAVKEFAQALSMEPKLEEARLELIDIYSEQGNTKKVIEIYNEILAIDPQNVQARMQLAVVYIEQGRKDQGNRILETLGVESQQDVEVMRKVVQLYLDPQNFDQAIMVLNGMLKSVPDNADLNYLAGIAYDGKGDTDTALQHFNRVTPGSRFYENAVVQISVIYQEKGQIQKAITYIQGIIKESDWVDDEWEKAAVAAARLVGI